MTKSKSSIKRRERISAFLRKADDAVHFNKPTWILDIIYDISFCLSTVLLYLFLCTFFESGADFSALLQLNPTLFIIMLSAAYYGMFEFISNILLFLVCYLRRIITPNIN